MKAMFYKPGWAILAIYSDGSSDFEKAQTTGFPLIWPSFNRSGAVSEIRRLRNLAPLIKEHPKYSVVKVKATWPEIV